MFVFQALVALYVGPGFLAAASPAHTTRAPSVS